MIITSDPAELRAALAVAAPPQPDGHGKRQRQAYS